jgi:hypothetical protein
MLALIAYWGFCFALIGSWGFYVSFYWHLMILCLLILISEGFYVCCYWFLGTLCLLCLAPGILWLLILVCGDFKQNTMDMVLLLTRDFYFVAIAYWGLLCCSYCLLGILFDSYYLLWIFMLLLLLTMDCYFTPNAYYGPLCCSYCLLWIAILLLMLTMDCYFTPIAYWDFILFLLLSLDFIFHLNCIVFTFI